MCGLVEANLDVCKIPEEQTVVVQSEAADFLRRNISPKTKRWDIVFFDPPYATKYLQVLEFIGTHASGLLTEDGLLVVEHHHKNDLQDEPGGIIRTRILKQGDSALSFYKRMESEV
jgi:16S rRNA G966 N2-methylase RsmD